MTLSYCDELSSRFTTKTLMYYNQFLAGDDFCQDLFPLPKCPRTQWVSQIKGGKCCTRDIKTLSFGRAPSKGYINFNYRKGHLQTRLNNVGFARLITVSNCANIRHQEKEMFFQLNLWSSEWTQHFFWWMIPLHMNVQCEHKAECMPRQINVEYHLTWHLSRFIWDAVNTKVLKENSYFKSVPLSKRPST